jgi:hypothetical protein
VAAQVGVAVGAVVVVVEVGVFETQTFSPGKMAQSALRLGFKDLN